MGYNYFYLIKNLEKTVFLYGNDDFGRLERGQVD
jgi:hypothetical protein